MRKGSGRQERARSHRRALQFRRVIEDARRQPTECILPLHFGILDREELLNVVAAIDLVVPALADEVDVGGDHDERQKESGEPDAILLRVQDQYLETS